MGRVKHSGTKLEKDFLKLAKIAKIKLKTDNKKIFGKPDFLLDSKIAIFLDSCFWHGCKKHHRPPASNKEYWADKILKNKKRDRKVNKELKIRGLKVVRIWEHEFKKNPEISFKKIFK